MIKIPINYTKLVEFSKYFNNIKNTTVKYKQRQVLKIENLDEASAAKLTLNVANGQSEHFCNVHKLIFA